MIKNIFKTLGLGFVFLTAATPALAHVSVKPSELGAAARTNFVVSVPTEEQNPTIGVRLVIPEGIASVRPNVKEGWNIQITKTGEGENERVSEINWTGGSIPADMKDEFTFSAQAPAQETNLVWRAYQTYSDGKVVSWDKDPKEVEEFEKNNPHTDGQEHAEEAPRPYSQTKIVNDLATNTATPAPVVSQQKSENLPMILSVVAITLSVGALWRQNKSKSK